MVLDSDNREGAIPNVKSQLDPTLFGVGAPTGNMVSFHNYDLKDVP